MKTLSLAVGLFLVGPGSAIAGMPSVTLTDVARLRLEAISFFLLGFLICAFCIQRLWNWLAKDFTVLPALSYPKALGLVGLWGLLFVLVLTMISGARELMTPGAWEKTGATYQLAKTAVSSTSGDDEQLGLRRRRLENLRDALWDYAKVHDGKFPTSISDSRFEAELWLIPNAFGQQYVYLAGVKNSSDDKLVAFEPELAPGDRLALLNNGLIRKMTNAEIGKALTVKR